MKTALITGSQGFVGNSFVGRLTDLGWRVTGVDTARAIAPLSRFHFLIRRDCRDWFEYHDASEFDIIIHCAAIVGGRTLIDGDPIQVATDLSIDAEFFNWVVKSKNKQQKVIYFSSSAVYPVEFQSAKHHIDLSESLVNFHGRIGLPDMTYGWAKLTGEYLAKHAVETYGTDVVIYRPFSGYGENQSLDYPFPSIVKRVIDGEDPVTIWGNGQQVRDFIHIDDIVNAVLETYPILSPGSTLNLGTGIPTSMSELAQRAWMLYRHGAPQLSPLPAKPSGVAWRVADIYKMSQFYTPRISLDEGIKRVAIHLTGSKFLE